ncbi:hypothetical protein [Tenacibaculum maritimum]|uniref:hypothetical protein n=1 Tax=Tenacibaculum maritimum TaxID=107401 RepID=UPI00132F605C|nr:hypothetical protein [Tenacibaculum maritimum]
MKATNLVIFKSESIEEPYYRLMIEGIGYVEIVRIEAKKFKNKLKYQETRIYKKDGFIARDYKII